MPSRRAGFTLIELLVVIAIIAILIALLVPAVQAVRESAARLQCVNNLKQIGLALHTHHDGKGKLPVGVNGDWAVYGTWQTKVLPYLERDNLHKLYDFTKTYSEAPNFPAVTTNRINILTCPSDTPSTGFSGITCHNYAANYGNTPVDYNPGAGYDTHQLPSFNGVTFGGAPFAQNKAFKLKDITDGTSTTLLAAEVIQGQQGDLRGFTWWGHGAIFVGYIGPNSSSPDVLYAGVYCKPDPPNPPCIGPGTASNPVMMAARSRHAGGVNVAMADGSCRFVQNSIALDTWRALSSSHGGEAISDEP